MPLQKPWAYLVCYDLKQPIDSYDKLFTELKNSHQWWHYLTNTWIVIHYDTLVDLSARLVPLIYHDDRLLIMPAKGPANGWLSRDAWTWIQERVPNEW